MDKRARIRIAIYILAGIAFVIAGMVLRRYDIIGYGVSRAIYCMGMPLLFFGIKDCWNLFKYPEMFKEKETEYREERNEQLQSKAGNISFIFTFASLLLLSAVFEDLEYKLPSDLTFWLAVLSLGVWLVTSWYYKRKL